MPTNPPDVLARLRAAVEALLATNRGSVHEAIARAELGVMLWHLDAEAGEPEPHTVPCVMCGKPSCTVEVCPEAGHADSCELSVLHGWVCSQECWERAAALTDTPPPSDVRERDALRYAIMEYDAGRLSADALAAAVQALVDERLLGALERVADSYVSRIAHNGLAGKMAALTAQVAALETFVKCADSPLWQRIAEYVTQSQLALTAQVEEIESVLPPDVRDMLIVKRAAPTGDAAQDQPKEVVPNDRATNGLDAAPEGRDSVNNAQPSPAPSTGMASVGDATWDIDTSRIAAHDSDHSLEPSPASSATAPRCTCLGTAVDQRDPHCPTHGFPVRAAPAGPWPSPRGIRAALACLGPDDRAPTMDMLQAYLAEDLPAIERAAYDRGFEAGDSMLRRPAIEARAEARGREAGVREFADWLADNCTPLYGKGETDWPGLIEDFLAEREGRKDA